MIDVEAALQLLSREGIEFIVIGGIAGRAHGSPRMTQDLDIVYARSPENIRRLVEAFRVHAPYPRGAPPGLPFLWDEETIRRGLNFTLTTTLGDLDILGEVTGGGAYPALLPETVEIDAFGCRFRCLNLDKLIHVKRAAGRPKDYEAVAELEVIREERRKRGP